MKMERVSKMKTIAIRAIVIEEKLHVPSFHVKPISYMVFNI